MTLAAPAGLAVSLSLLVARGGFRLARARSPRPYGGFGEIGRMVTRAASARLGYSPLLLAGTVAGMVLTYLAPPALSLSGGGLARGARLLAWLLMALAFRPMLRIYRAPPLWGLALPGIGTACTLLTPHPVPQVWRGRGGMWKRRAQAMADGT
ncbi:MAG: glycosyl transferase family 2 [Roseomonas sp.]|nr:glycosyl transferase family 2 [Roseomonas sp.]